MCMLICDGALIVTIWLRYTSYHTAVVLLCHTLVTISGFTNYVHMCDYSSPRDRADSELTDATTDPQIEQSDDDQLEDSPRDASNASSTEAQELRLQLTELRELLAQKVLLINELQGLCLCVVLNSRYVFYYP